MNRQRLTSSRFRTRVASTGRGAPIVIGFGEALRRAVGAARSAYAYVVLSLRYKGTGFAP